MTEQYWVFTDFDGTVTLDDNQVMLLDTFAPQGWREREYAILDRGGKSRLYLPEIYRGFGMEPQEMLDFIRANVRPDPYFKDFAEFCREQGLPLEILSDGLHLYIEDFLERHGLQDLRYYSNLVQVSPGGFEFSHPHSDSSCNKCGTCKKQTVLKVKKQGYRIIYIGDGISDECPAEFADILFAKGKLAAFCQRQGIPCHHYETFAQVLEFCRGLLGNEVNSDANQ